MSSESVVLLSSIEEYENHIQSDCLSVVHFYAPWADQCMQVNDVLKEMNSLSEYKDVKFGKIIAEDLPEIALKVEITAVPVVLLFKKGKIIDRVNGVNIAILTESIKKHMKDKNFLADDIVKPKEALESRLRKLINQGSCMLFMKGNPVKPRCGFSKTIVSILDSYDTDYQTFDILEDNEVREGLKKFSNWPTYPQLYVNGELLGGLDIVKEMHESGDLKDTLPRKSESEES